MHRLQFAQLGKNCLQVSLADLARLSAPDFDRVVNIGKEVCHLLKPLVRGISQRTVVGPFALIGQRTVGEVRECHDCNAFSAKANRTRNNQSRLRGGLRKVETGLSGLWKVYGDWRAQVNATALTRVRWSCANLTCQIASKA